MVTRDTQSHEEYLPIGETARMLGVTVDTVRRWEKAGRIHANRTLGGQRRFARTEVEQLQARSHGRVSA